jgi:hypothetical protein
MKQVVIENPVLNSPFEVPERHFKFDDEGITNEIVEARRTSAYIIPIAKPKMKGKLFPWVVSDFSLIDAIESGIVKVPRVPVADDAMQAGQPTYRDLWLRISDRSDAAHILRTRLAAERSQ